MMSAMGLTMLVGLMVLTTVVIGIARSSSSFETKSKRKNDELLRNDEIYLIGDDGEIIEYSEGKVKWHI